MRPGAPRPPRAESGRGVKLRVLVDKLMQPEEDRATKEWPVRETADAGFNVASLRRGHDRLDEVRRVTDRCRKCGTHYMPWMRGTLTAPEGEEANGKRLVQNGTEPPLWSPNADEFWQWTSEWIVQYAQTGTSCGSTTPPGGSFSARFPLVARTDAIRPD